MEQETATCIAQLVLELVVWTDVLWQVDICGYLQYYGIFLPWAQNRAWPLQGQLGPELPRRLPSLAGWQMVHSIQSARMKSIGIQGRRIQERRSIRA